MTKYLSEKLYQEHGTIKPMSRSAHGLALLASGLSLRLAAEQAGINQSTLWRAKRSLNRPVCPSCGQRIRIATKGE